MNEQLILDELDKIIIATKEEILKLEEMADKENSIDKEDEF